MFKKKINIFVVSFLLCTTLGAMENEPKTPETQNTENEDHYTPTKDRHLNSLFQVVLIDDPESFRLLLEKQPENLYKEITGGRYEGQSPYSYILDQGLTHFLTILYQTNNITIQEIEKILQDQKIQRNMSELYDSDETIESLHPNTEEWMKNIINQNKHNNLIRLMENNTNYNIIEKNTIQNKNIVRIVRSVPSNQTLTIKNPIAEKKLDAVSPSVLFECIHSKNFKKFEKTIKESPLTLFIKNENNKYSFKKPYEYILKYGYIDFLEILYRTETISLMTIKKDLLEEQIFKKQLEQNNQSKRISKKTIHPNIMLWMSKQLYTSCPDYIFEKGLLNALKVLYKNEIITRKIITQYLQKNKIEKKIAPSIENWIKEKIQTEGEKNIERIIFNKFYTKYVIKNIQEKAKKIVNDNALRNHFEQKDKPLESGKSYIMTPFFGLIEENNFKKISK